MPTAVLGLQAGLANGSEPTFDGQPMQIGTHLRWAAAPELGFPPGGYWLLRRVASPGEKKISPPRAVVDALGAASQVSQAQAIGGASSVAGGATFPATGGATAREPECRCGCVPSGCCCNRTCGHSCTGGGQGGGGGQGSGGGQGGGGQGGGGTGGPGWPVGGKPGWGGPDDGGWQLWSQPFTLPVTAANWPARYAGALDPATHSAAALRARDVLECRQRLHGLSLVAGMSASTQTLHFETLRSECVRLVQGWPATPLFDVGLQPSPDGAHAPLLTMGLVEQLALTALSPYAARVLGLYFVDTETSPETSYDYCIVGVWGGTPVASRLYTPGSAPPGPLARGKVTFGPLSVAAAADVAHLYPWQRDDANGNYIGRVDPSAPGYVAAACAAAVAALPLNAQPVAMLAASTPEFTFPFPLPPIDALVCDLTVTNPAAALDIEVAGSGTVTALAGGTVVSSQTFGSAILQTLTFAAVDPVNAPLDELQITTTGFGSVVVVGNVVAHVVANDVAGTLFALVHAPAEMQAPPVPPQPVAVFRKREAGVELPGPAIVARSFFTVEFAVTPLASADYVGNPTGGAVELPPPRRAIGYVARRADGDINNPTPIPRLLAAAPQATPPGSPLLPAPFVIAFSDSGLPDPAHGYAYSVASFGIFGERSSFGPWSAAVGVEHIAAAPTSLALIAFRNAPADGGAAEPPPPATASAWVGGTLAVTASWSGSALLMYPDVKSARLTVTALDANDKPLSPPAPPLVVHDFSVPAPDVLAFVLGTPVVDAVANAVYVNAVPAFPALDPNGPAASLTLAGTLADGTSVVERYAVRPAIVPAHAGLGVVATLPLSTVSRIATNPSAFAARPCYLVTGVSVTLSVPTPLAVAVGTATARGQCFVQGSRAVTFDPNEVIVDPNGLALPRPEPSSNPITFAGAQRLEPPAPPTPVHSVDHEYYDLPDYLGNASKQLPFDTSAGLPATSGYLLRRAPAHGLFITDIKRRGSNLTDPNPAIAGRPDLQAWIDALPQWLAAYNVREGRSLSGAQALADADAVRSFIQHFYGGLLDDELRALADLSGNDPAFTQTNGAKSDPGTPIVDTVDGTGFGRSLYKLVAVNGAGTRGANTGSIGPYYTRAATPSLPPILASVVAQARAVVPKWVLDDDPNVAGYLLYRATDPAQLADVRYFGADRSHPSSPSSLAQTAFDPAVWQGFSLTAGALDPRLIALVNDPRVFARDYAGSDAGEIPLPPGPPPEAVLGVFRLGEFDLGAAQPQVQPGAFNYWKPPATGGFTQVMTAGGASRLVGLRIGLGRGVPVVVVLQSGTTVTVLGSVPSRRASFTDGAAGGGGPADPNALSTWSAPNPATAYYYAVVTVDIAGNRSAPSAPFGAPVLVSA